MLPTSGKLSIGELKVYNVHCGICSLLLLGLSHTLDSPTPSPLILALSNPFSHLPTSSLSSPFFFFHLHHSHLTTSYLSNHSPPLSPPLISLVLTTYFSTLPLSSPLHSPLTSTLLSPPLSSHLHSPLTSLSPLTSPLLSPPLSSHLHSLSPPLSSHLHSPLTSTLLSPPVTPHLSLSPYLTPPREHAICSPVPQCSPSQSDCSSAQCQCGSAGKHSQGCYHRDPGVGH